MYAVNLGTRGPEQRAMLLSMPITEAEVPGVTCAEKMEWRNRSG